MKFCKHCEQPAIWAVIPFENNKAKLGHLYFECPKHSSIEFKDISYHDIKDN